MLINDFLTIVKLNFKLHFNIYHIIEVNLDLISSYILLIKCSMKVSLIFEPYTIDIHLLSERSSQIKSNQ